LAAAGVPSSIVDGRKAGTMAAFVLGSDLGGTRVDSR